MSISSYRCIQNTKYLGFPSHIKSFTKISTLHFLRKVHFEYRTVFHGICWSHESDEDFHSHPCINFPWRQNSYLNIKCSIKYIKRFCPEVFSLSEFQNFLKPMVVSGFYSLKLYIVFQLHWWPCKIGMLP